ncbi:hypothetical protein CCAX7_65360 [Capsulimonas corticalis]|uniref:Uncharacterized protein n=1 Tax=Capsulimonas corticalis TaxID=2219043 RepID=A0A402CR23_9BACT|nr:flotillin-like FloA family protein [Capsulimonas corticalis]BDI34485.1 hypothetical protein CCAX7_65360 [Capsulimonas corticalis]
MYIYLPHLVLLLIVPILLILVLRFLSIGSWINAKAAGIQGVSLAALIGMRLRKVPPTRVVNPLIAAVKAGVPVNVIQLETHYLAGGNVDRIVSALISAHRAGIPLSVERAAMLDLQRVNVLEVVQASVAAQQVDPRLTATAE